MTKDPHFLALQNMYLAAPINEFYRPSIEVSDAEATIEIDVSDEEGISRATLENTIKETVRQIGKRVVEERVE